MPNTSLQILTKIYNACHPARPLQKGNPYYVDCQAVRGDSNIEMELGRDILFLDEPSHQLYAGHRGAGKSTELLHLKAYLETNGCFVVYFAADEEDIDSEDAQYTDILLACTRHLLDALKDKANPEPILTWLKSRWESLKELAFAEVVFEKLDINAQIALFAKLTASVRAIPDSRQEIRKKLNPHTVTLIEALNTFIEEAKAALSSQYEQLVVIVDNLDRIVPVVQEDGRTNLEQIFIDRSEQLCALSCNVVYTVPISMLFSTRSPDLRMTYGGTPILPMVMVRLPDGSVHQPGMAVMQEIVMRRVRPILHEVGLNSAVEDVFDTPETLQQLCLMSGGHVRELLHLMQFAAKRSEQLPLTARLVQRSITEARDDYRRAVKSAHWQILAKVAKRKRCPNENLYLGLLFNRCILEYRYFDEDGELHCWYDVHPLIRGIKEFKEALERLEDDDTNSD